MISQAVARNGSCRHASSIGVLKPRQLTCRCTARSSASNPEQQGQQQQQQRVAAGCMAALASAALVFGPCAQPPAALAVSGGTSGSATGYSYQDQSGKDFRGLRLTKAEMRQTKFDGANFSGVTLFGALAEKASFAGANLEGADLESGNFEGADFTNANLTGAMLTNTQLKGVTITGADFTDVVLRKDVQKFLCSIASGTNPTTGVDTRESLLCPE